MNHHGCVKPPSLTQQEKHHMVKLLGGQAEGAEHTHQAPTHLSSGTRPDGRYQPWQSHLPPATGWPQHHLQRWVIAALQLLSPFYLSFPCSLSGTLCKGQLLVGDLWLQTQPPFICVCFGNRQFLMETNLCLKMLKPPVTGSKHGRGGA